MKLIKFSILHPKTVILIMGLLTIPFLCYLPELKKEEDAWAIIPSGSQTKEYYHRIKERFNQNDLIIIGIETKGGIFNYDTLEKIKNLTDKLQDITLVTTKEEDELVRLISHASGEIRRLLVNIGRDGLARSDVYGLGKIEEYINQQEQLDIELKRWIDDLRVRLFPFRKVNSLFTIENLKGTEYGLSVAPLIKKLPESDEHLMQTEEDVLANDLFNNIFISSDVRSALIALELAFSESDMDLLRPLYYKIEDIIDSETGPEKIYLGGTPVLWFLEHKLLNKDFNFLFPIVFVAIMFLLLIFFKRLQGVYLPMMIVGVSVIWSLGLMSILNIKLSVIGNVIPVVLTATGTADAIHILFQYYGELTKGLPKKAALEKTMERLSKPVVMTSITTIAGFASLASSEIPMIRDFGIFTSIGIFIAMILSLTFVPAALTLSKDPRVKKIFTQEADRIDDGIFNKCGVVLESRRWVFLPIIVIVICAVVFGASRVVIQYSPTELFKAGSDIRKAHNFFNKNFAGVTGLNVVLESNKDNAFKTPELLEKMNVLQMKITEHNQVGKAISIVDYVKRMNFVMHDEDESYNRIPQSVEKVTDFEWVEVDGKEIVREQDFEVTGYDQISQYLLLYEGAGGRDLSKVIDDKYKEANINVFLKTDNSTTNKDIIKTIGMYCKEMFTNDISVSFSGVSTLFIDLADMIIKGQLLSIAISIGIVFIMIVLMIRSLLFGALGILPIIFTVLCNFAIMKRFSVPLDIGTALVSSIAIGIGVDYCIHYLTWVTDERRKGSTLNEAARKALSGVGKPVMLNAMVVAAGFLVLIFSNFVPIINFGWMVCLTMVISSVSTLIIIPTILFAFTKKNRCVLLSLFSIFVSSLIFVNTSSADNMTGYQIMEKVYKRENGNDASAEIKFVIVYPDGKEKIRNTRRLWIDLDGRDGFSEKTLFFFLSPPEIKDSAFLVWNYEKYDMDDKQWIYLPALRKVRRIASGSNNDSFFGTEFGYADLNMRTPDEDAHTLLRNEILSDRDCYVVESIPKDPKGTYSRTVHWIDVVKWTVIKTEYYDREGRHLKTQMLKWELIQNIWTSTSLVMENHINRNKTIATIWNVQYNNGLEDRMFHERTLKTGVR